MKPTLDEPADCPNSVTFAWIATKSCDVRVNPAQRRDLIEQSVISGDLVL